jgi:hypothetical protein
MFVLTAVLQADRPGRKKSERKKIVRSVIQIEEDGFWKHEKAKGPGNTRKPSAIPMNPITKLSKKERTVGSYRRNH